jgi:hypothetical protein
MKTLNEIIEIIRSENPNGIKLGNHQDGYTELTESEYETQLTQWAVARLEKLEKLAEAQAIIEAKKQAVIKLTELGIDPKAFDLNTQETTHNFPNGD